MTREKKEKQKGNRLFFSRSCDYSSSPSFVRSIRSSSPIVRDTQFFFTGWPQSGCRNHCENITWSFYTTMPRSFFPSLFTTDLLSINTWFWLSLTRRAALFGRFVERSNLPDRTNTRQNCRRDWSRETVDAKHNISSVIYRGQYIRLR